MKGESLDPVSSRVLVLMRKLMGNCGCLVIEIPFLKYYILLTYSTQLSDRLAQGQRRNDENY